jgi:hypothetical protein
MSPTRSGDSRKRTKPSDISQLLSDVFDRVFGKSPRIRNELIVRRTLSSAAAMARQNLIEAMLQRADQPTLGIEGFPPERSIYESVLGVAENFPQLNTSPRSIAA